MIIPRLTNCERSAVEAASDRRTSLLTRTLASVVDVESLEELFRRSSEEFEGIWKSSEECR